MLHTSLLLHLQTPAHFSSLPVLHRRNATELDLPHSSAFLILNFFSWWIQSLCDMAMSISVQSLGLILLAAVLLQTIAVAVSFMYFNKVLNTVRNAFGLRGTHESEWEASNMVSWHASWEQAKLTKNTDLHWGMRLIPVEQDKYDRGQRNCILKHELQMTCGPQI